MTRIEIDVIPYFDDNFSYLIHQSGSSGATALVDCGDAGPVLSFLENNNINLNYILATHSHYDHAGDISSLVNQFPNATVIKPKGEKRIDVAGKEVSDGETIPFGDLIIEVLAVPAHTNYCLSYKIEDCIFVGDALFSAGCGRMFEGQPADLERAMDKLSSLPGKTKVYFGHEYTKANLKFALSIEPDNQKTKDYMTEVEEKVKSGMFSTPSTIALEKEINPFFRIDQDSVIKSIDPSKSLSRTERMAALRHRKDNF
ncbi:hydroxyacylglutathione hydrolase [bacterium]|nr:hydroxyacylglutathione hydrolase [bacterium]